MAGRGVIVGDPVRRAQDAIVFSRGLEEAGLAEAARQLRLLARDVLELSEALAAEQSVRRAIEARRDELLAIVGKAAYRACVEAST